MSCCKKKAHTQLNFQSRLVICQQNLTSFVLLYTTHALLSYLSHHAARYIRVVISTINNSGLHQRGNKTTPHLLPHSHAILHTFVTTRSNPHTQSPKQWHQILLLMLLLLTSLHLEDRFMAGSRILSGQSIIFAIAVSTNTAMYERDLSYRFVWKSNN